MNPFETGARKVIPAVLVYARFEGRILMIHRNARSSASDYHSGKWNGLGGKCELDESPLEAAVREFHEEAGVRLESTAFVPAGTIQFPNFKPHRAEDWLVFVWTCELKPEEARQVRTRVSSDEGELHWIEESALMSLNLWAGDQHFLPYVLERKAFLGTIWYGGETVLRHWLVPLT